MSETSALERHPARRGLSIIGILAAALLFMVVVGGVFGNTPREPEHSVHRLLTGVANTDDLLEAVAFSIPSAAICAVGVIASTLKFRRLHDWRNVIMAGLNVLGWVFVLIHSAFPVSLR